MAKKGYPGLVLVPPSDRTILRRRLLHGALFIVALIWCVSILPLWPPVSDEKDNCPSHAGQDGSKGSVEPCNQPQSAKESPSHQSEFNLIPLLQAEGLRESQNPLPSPIIPNLDGQATTNNPGQASMLTSPDPVHPSSEHTVAPPASGKPRADLPSSSSAHTPDVEIQRAEQGDAFAQYHLGRYYARRDGRQTPESVSWYKKASPGLHRLADTGNGQAMYVLGVMYAYGRGVPRNTDEARRWLTQAVERKITAAQPVLASLDVYRKADPKPKVSEQDKR